MVRLRRRYFAVADPTVDRVILRDVDSYAVLCAALRGGAAVLALSGDARPTRSRRAGMPRAARGVADRACDATRRRYIGQREADAVAEWIASGQPLHFMHDHAATMELQVAR